MPTLKIKNGIMEFTCPNPECLMTVKVKAKKGMTLKRAWGFPHGCVHCLKIWTADPVGQILPVPDDVFADFFGPEAMAELNRQRAEALNDSQLQAAMKESRERRMARN